MKIVVIGGTGLIGSKLVRDLAAQGHEAVTAAPATGVDTLTGEGLPQALEGAVVVVDVSNSRAFDEKTATDFFTKSTSNLLNSEREAGVRHHVALSVVGTERPSEIGYFHAKAAQEKLIKESGLPYSIIHATQFFEFLNAIADIATEGNEVHLPSALIQPIAADDVAADVAEVATGGPLNQTVQIAGPQQFRVDDFVRHGLAAMNDPREVVADPGASFYGAHISERTLIPTDGASLGKTRFDDWLRKQTAAA